MSDAQKVILVILDGFGIRESSDFNAVKIAKKPNIDWLLKECPSTTLDGSGLSVGLPRGQMGNSEVGHMNIGAGRVVYKDGDRKNHSMENLFIVSCADYEKAVNVALQVLAETKIKEVEINSPKDLIKLLAIKGLDSIGYENVSAIIKLSALGRVQKARAMKYIRGLTTSST